MSAVPAIRAGAAASQLRPPAGTATNSEASLGLRAVLVALTIATGLVDAACYLGMGHVLVANMTGNIVFLGFALGGAKQFSIAAFLVALGSFLVSAAVGGRFAVLAGVFAVVTAGFWVNGERDERPA